MRNEFIKVVLSGLFISSLASGSETIDLPSGGRLGEDSESLSQSVVLNGRVAKPVDGFHRFTVRLDIENRKGKSNICTGFIIAPDIILTAGHCLVEDQLKIKVKFGFGGKAGFTHTLATQNYLSVFPAEHKPAEPNPDAPQTPPSAEKNPSWLKGKLNINLEQQKAYYKDLLERSAFVNFYQSGFFKTSALQDYAIVRIPHLPAGYGVIQPYNGQLPFRQEVFHVGFGTHSQVQKENDFSLRWAPAQLTGYYEEPDQNDVMGLQTFAPNKQQACFGDSGGPLVVRYGHQFHYIGINSFVFNHCGNSNWYLYAPYFKTKIDQLIARLRQLRST